MLSIPAQSLRTNLAVWAPHIGPGTVIVSLMKGIEPGTGKSVDQAASATRQTTEGVKSADSILDLARVHGTEMPITEIAA